MLYTEQELKEIVRLCVDGMKLEEAKTKALKRHIIEDYESAIKNIHDTVCEYFEVDNIFPANRETRNLAPMAVFAYLIMDSVSQYRYKEVHEAFSTYTGRSRCTFYHYIDLYEKEAHLHDIRVVKKDYICNHFINLKEKITGKKIDDIPKKKYEPKRTFTTCYVRFEKNEEDIITDIKENFYSYQELNDKYFFMSEYENVKKFFARERPELVKLIRTDRRTAIGKAIAERRKEFIKCLKEGYTIKEMNDRFDLYGRHKGRLHNMMYTYERRIYNILMQNEKSRK
jgi:hypothetical protein